MLRNKGSGTVSPGSVSTLAYSPLSVVLLLRLDGAFFSLPFYSCPAYNLMKSMSFSQRVEPSIYGSIPLSRPILEK